MTDPIESDLARLARQEAEEDALRAARVRYAYSILSKPQTISARILADLHDSIRAEIALAIFHYEDQHDMAHAIANMLASEGWKPEPHMTVAQQAQLADEEDRARGIEP